MVAQPIQIQELAAPFSSAGHWRDSFGRRSRPLPSASAEMTLQEVVTGAKIEQFMVDEWLLMGKTWAVYAWFMLSGGF